MSVATRTDPEAVYAYQDEDAQTLYEVVRFPGKKFMQRRPDGRWGLENTRRVLYRLPQLIAHIEANRREPIYICEGEKDVHAIEAAGGLATCNPMGAGKWTDEYSEQLQGARRIVIVVDNDPDQPDGRNIGLDHAVTIIRSLGTVGLTAEITYAREGKDAADHFENGYTLNDLLETAHEFELPIVGPPVDPAAPIHLETWREFAGKATERIPCIIEGLWPEGSLAFIASPPKKGKTWLGLALALSVATGRPYLSRFVVGRPRTVIYVALEGHRGALTARIGCLARGMGVDPDKEIDNFHLIYKPRGMNIADSTWAQHLINVAAGIQSELVIVDVLRAAALIKENAAEDFAALRSNLAPLLDGGASLAFLHHFTKLSETSKERTPAERMSGSGAMYGALDVGVFITGSENGARKLRLEFDGRDIAMPEPLGIELKGEGHGDNEGLTYTDTAWWEKTETPDQDDVEAPATEIVAWLIENGAQASEYEIAAAFDCSQKTIARRRHRLEQLGVEWHSPPGKKGVYRVIANTTDKDDLGHDLGQDTLDSVQGQNVSRLNPAETSQKQPKNADPGQGWTNGRVQPQESADLQEKHTPDTLDSLRERPDPVQGRPPEEPADPELESLYTLEPDRDDIPF
jgi:hypothetical protein